MYINSKRSGFWPTTHWSLLGRAGSGGIEERRQALTSLVQVYLPAMRQHLLFRRNISRDMVDDLLQDFLVSKVLEKDILTLATQGRGRFRTFLATALDRFVFNCFRNNNVAKRTAIKSGPLDEVDLRDLASAEKAWDIFDAAWARQVLGQAIRHMRRECAKHNRHQLWRIFAGRVLFPALRNVPPVPFERLADDLKLESSKRASTILTTGNRMFAHSLQSVIGTYDSGKADVESELRDLRQIFSRSHRERG
jgi:RNA polymerase sigma-70 factor (ECF subfamily)